MADVSKITATDGTTYDIKDTTARAHSVPAGGIQGQVLGKVSATNWDLAWIDQTGASGEVSAEDTELRAEVFGGLVASIEIEFDDPSASVLFYPNTALEELGEEGSYEFTRNSGNTAWLLDNSEVDIAEYGVEIPDYSPVVTDTFTIVISDVPGLAGETDEALANLSQSVTTLSADLSSLASTTATNTDDISGLSDRFNTLDNYVSASASGLKMSGASGDYYTLASDSELGFYGDNVRQAYVTDSGLVAGNVTVSSMLNLGGYELDIASDGSLVVKWVG